MTQAEIREKGWAYVVANFLCLRPKLQVDPGDSLLRQGVFGSLGMTEVTSVIEETLGTSVEQKEAREAHPGKINVNSPYIEAKPSNA